MRALQLKEQGWTQCHIASALDVSEGAVCQWLTTAEQDGRSPWLIRHPGRHARRLTAGQKPDPEFLWHGPEAYGFRGEVWTCARVAHVIEEEFGVRYHKGHVGRLLEDLRWTPRCRSPAGPARRGGHRAVAKGRLARPGRQASARNRVLVFVDEAGFYLLPGAVRTYAPVGQTPVLRVKQSRDHLSVMGGLTPRGKVYTLARQEPLNGLHCIEFLVHLGGWPETVCW